MKTTTFASVALVAASNFLTAFAKDGEQLEAESPVLNQLKSYGCFASNANMTEVGSGTKVSSGYCYNLCKNKKYSVMGLQADVCYCGMVYPPEDDKAKDANCNYPCPAYPPEACGALRKYYSIFNTGLELAVDDYVPEESTTSSAASSTKASVAESSAAESSVPTESASTPQESGSDGSDEKKDDGPNVGAIVAGVVVGVVAIIAIAGGAIFFVRRRRNAEIEEEHRRNAAVNAFINGSKPPGSSGSISMTDSRLDPVMAHRRLSDGSIADNQDYSRRILRVTNA
ncbi:hypothetical protein NM208_g14524 [Fusarium decemcellulare]|uniref:Uncharacterized protein n=1 Tax=Fusarium decemcellulare TaxID=57161 RepID=A0ACC1RJW8_9HYPO|nr:hypothetical protein NM208_g14524 [Fusarium decemcellulare]